PTGLIWDSVNHSCAYDALFTCMYNVWVEHGPKWSARLTTISGYNALLAAGLDSVAGRTRSLQHARDVVRQSLMADYPAYFPMGSSLTSLDRLTEAMFAGSHWGTEIEKCNRCSLVRRSDPGAQCLSTITVDNLLRSRYKQRYSISHWIAANRVRNGRRACTGCGNGTTVFESFQHPPPLLLFSLGDDNILIDSLLNIDVAGQKKKYAVRGVIYSGSNHFTSRVVAESGLVWYHDGIETGSTMIAEGSLYQQNPTFLNKCIRTDSTRKAACVLYAAVE
ncbi:hypothetical protein K438DRAFT_1656200, partial [Mycena galopus ATCC 62051]